MNDGSPKKRRLQAMGLLVILAIAVAAAAASGCQRLDKAGKNWESGMERWSIQLRR